MGVFRPAEEDGGGGRLGARENGRSRNYGPVGPGRLSSVCRSNTIRCRQARTRGV